MPKFYIQVAFPETLSEIASEAVSTAIHQGLEQACKDVGFNGTITTGSWCEMCAMRRPEDLPPNGGRLVMDDQQPEAAAHNALVNTCSGILETLCPHGGLMITIVNRPDPHAPPLVSAVFAPTECVFGSKMTLAGTFLGLGRLLSFIGEKTGVHPTILQMEAHQIAASLKFGHETLRWENKKGSNQE